VAEVFLCAATPDAGVRVTLPMNAQVARLNTRNAGVHQGPGNKRDCRVVFSCKALWDDLKTARELEGEGSLAECMRSPQPELYELRLLLRDRMIDNRLCFLAEDGRAPTTTTTAAERSGSDEAGRAEARPGGGAAVRSSGRDRRSKRTWSPGHDQDPAGGGGGGAGGGAAAATAAAEASFTRQRGGGWECFNCLHSNAASVRVELLPNLSRLRGRARRRCTRCHTRSCQEIKGYAGGGQVAFCGRCDEERESSSGVQAELEAMGADGDAPPPPLALGYDARLQSLQCMPPGSAPTRAASVVTGFAFLRSQGLLDGASAVPGRECAHRPAVSTAPSPVL
jgi:hypothetical protein